jgi:hypothetical protein
MARIIDSRVGPVVPKLVRIAVPVFRASALVAAGELVSHTTMINQLLTEALEMRGVDIESNESVDA